MIFLSHKKSLNCTIVASIGISNIILDNSIKSKFEFPFKALEWVQDQNLHLVTLPKLLGGKELGISSGNTELLTILKKVGNYNLSMGRIFEGHINALLLIEQFGNSLQKNSSYQEAKEGMLFGIWNAELPFEPLKLDIKPNYFILNGAKFFCSGGSYIYRPIITASKPQGKQMIIAHLNKYNLKEDFSYWDPLGMEGSRSCRFDFTGIKIETSQLLGNIDDYEKEPDFTGGAARFAAVQLGAVEGVIEDTIFHLTKNKRARDPYQKHRIAKLQILRTRGNLWLERAGEITDQKNKDPEAYINFSDLFRTEIRQTAQEVLNICEYAIGLQSMMGDHPLQQKIRDLMVYLKQPGPDAALCRIGDRIIDNFENFENR